MFFTFLFPYELTKIALQYIYIMVLGGGRGGRRLLAMKVNNSNVIVLLQKQFLVITLGTLGNL